MDGVTATRKKTIGQQQTDMDINRNWTAKHDDDKNRRNTQVPAARFGFKFRFQLGNYYNYYGALEKQLSSQISRTVITIRALIGRRRLIKNDEPKQMRTVSSPPVNGRGGGDGGDCGISRAEDHGSRGVGRRIALGRWMGEAAVSSSGV